MKLKDFRQTEIWKLANCVRYFDEEGKEIDIADLTETKKRRLYNSEVKSHGTEIVNGIATLEIQLK